MKAKALLLSLIGAASLMALANAAPLTNSAPVAPGAQKSMPPRPNGGAPNSNTITPQEWQQMNADRSAALKANPALMKNAIELSARVRAFQQKLDAAILKADPNAAAFIQKMEPNGLPNSHPGIAPNGPAFAPTAAPSLPAGH